VYTEGKTLQRCRCVNRGSIGTGQVAGTEKMEGWAEGLGREPWAWGLGLGPRPWGWQVCLVERRCRGVGVLLGFADGCFLAQLTVLILGPPGEAVRLFQRKARTLTVLSEVKIHS